MGEAVREMFDTIARRYDLANLVLSFGIDEAWRVSAARLLRLEPGALVLDSATGTGDLAIAIAHALAPCRVVGTDFSEGMLAHAPNKARRHDLNVTDAHALLRSTGVSPVPPTAPSAQALTDSTNRSSADARARRPRPQAATSQANGLSHSANGGHGQDAHATSTVAFAIEDAMAYSFAADTFDGATIAFGIRNVDDPVTALREFRRVLKPGAPLVVLEFGQPDGRLFGPLYRLYSGRMLPTIGGILTGASDAYAYLHKTSSAFPCGPAFVEMMTEAGFTDIESRPLTFGIAWLYRGEA